MAPTREPLRMFGSTSEVEPLEWAWVRAHLESAGTYWVVARTSSHPHPRPVWGVWFDDALGLSLGSPVLRSELAADPTVTVHLDSGTDVVIVEGTAEALTNADTVGPVRAYNEKYDWDYAIDDYGPFTRVSPRAVLAWRAAGPAGRDGFRQVGRWRFG
jgi:hypothetical protein